MGAKRLGGRNVHGVECPGAELNNTYAVRACEREQIGLVGWMPGEFGQFSLWPGRGQGSLPRDFHACAIEAGL